MRDYRSELLEAIEDGDLEKVRTAVERVNLRSMNTPTLWSYALGRGSLLDKAVQIQAFGGSHRADNAYAKEVAVLLMKRHALPTQSHYGNSMVPAVLNHREDAAIAILEKTKELFRDNPKGFLAALEPIRLNAKEKEHYRKELAKMLRLSPDLFAAKQAAELAILDNVVVHDIFAPRKPVIISSYRSADNIPYTTLYPDERKPWTPAHEDSLLPGYKKLQKPRMTPYSSRFERYADIADMHNLPDDVPEHAGDSYWQKLTSIEKEAILYNMKRGTDVFSAQAKFLGKRKRQFATGALSEYRNRPQPEILEALAEEVFLARQKAAEAKVMAAEAKERAKKEKKENAKNGITQDAPEQPEVKEKPAKKLHPSLMVAEYIKLKNSQATYKLRKERGAPPISR